MAASLCWDAMTSASVVGDGYDEGGRVENVVNEICRDDDSDV